MTKIVVSLWFEKYHAKNLVAYGIKIYDSFLQEPVELIQSDLNYKIILEYIYKGEMGNLRHLLRDDYGCQCSSIEYECTVEKVCK